MYSFFKTAIISLFSLIFFIGFPKNANAQEPLEKLNVLLITIDTFKSG